MVHFRRQRLGDQIRVELAMLLQQEVRDPRLGFVTVTEVRMSPDLKHARVYVSIFGDEISKKASLGVLDRARGFLRSRIGSRLEIRYVPELRFVIDETLDESDRIDALLDDAADGEESADGEEPADGEAPADG